MIAFIQANASFTADYLCNVQHFFSSATKYWPLPGKYSFLPDRLAQPSVENNTIDGIYFDFKQLVREMSVFIIRKPRGGQSQKVVNFGAESVLLGTQKYKRDIYFTYNIRLALFGRGLAQLHEQELISAQKKHNACAFLLPAQDQGGLHNCRTLLYDA